MNVRPTEPRDADAVLALMEGLTRPAVADDPHPQRDAFFAHLGHADAEVFVVELDGQVAGKRTGPCHTTAEHRTRSVPQAWIPDLLVDPSFRRRGAARALLDACVAEARRRGCHRLVLESGHHRAEAHRLYDAYGFEHYGRAYALKL